MSGEVPERLISDADREAVVERLRAATAEGRLSLDEFSDRVGEVYGARTAGDLERLTGDLPAVAEDRAPRVRPTDWVVGVLSGTRRSGPWRPGEPTRALAFLGSCQIDLTGVDLAPETHLVVYVALGGVEVLVPEGVGVDLGGFSVLGGHEDRTSTYRAPGAPIVRVDSRCVLGGVTVRTRPFTRR